MEWKQQAKGFSLIELMIAMAIIGVLATISLDAYQTYTTRAKMTEVIQYAGKLKLDIMEHYSYHNEFPDSSTNMSSPNPEFMVRVLVVKANTSKVTILIHLDRNQVPGSYWNPHFQLQGVVQSDRSVVWHCGSRNWWRVEINKAYLPTSCQEAVDDPWN